MGWLPIRLQGTDFFVNGVNVGNTILQELLHINGRLFVVAQDEAGYRRLSLDDLKCFLQLLLFAVDDDRLSLDSAVECRLQRATNDDERTDLRDWKIFFFVNFNHRQRKPPVNPLKYTICDRKTRSRFLSLLSLIMKWQKKFLLFKLTCGFERNFFCICLSLKNKTILNRLKFKTEIKKLNLFWRPHKVVDETFQHWTPLLGNHDSLLKGINFFF